MNPRRMSALLVPLALALVSCAARGGEVKSPDQRLAEGWEKLEDIRRYGGGQGTELAAQEVYYQLDQATQHKMAQLTATAAGIATQQSLLATTEGQ